MAEGMLTVRLPARDLGGASTMSVSPVQLDELFPHADRTRVEIDVRPPQGDHLAPSQAREGGQQDQRTEALVGQLEDLGHGEDGPLRRLFVVRVLDPARVPAE
ncbi:hypothetical protein B1L11_05745 [Microbispora sp. GKU 823]|nr:hypothetical protein B1L11_05745 [Microbispora sp. GKU 823]